MNCSARREASVTGAPVRSVVYSVAALLLSGSVSIAGATTRRNSTMSRRAFSTRFTPPTRARLKRCLRCIDGMEVDAGLIAMKSYHAAYGRWRLAQIYAASVAADRSRSGARAASARAAETCAKDAQAAVAADARMAEAYAIHAVCDGFPPAGGEDGVSHEVVAHGDFARAGQSAGSVHRDAMRRRRRRIQGDCATWWPRLKRRRPE